MGLAPISGQLARVQGSNATSPAVLSHAVILYNEIRVCIALRHASRQRGGEAGGSRLHGSVQPSFCIFVWQEVLEGTVSLQLLVRPCLI